MYASVNLEGRLVNDPEFKNGKDDHEFCTFRVAVNQQYGQAENASFYNCIGGSTIARRIRNGGICKGKMIHINGNLMMKSFEKNGVERISPEVGILDWHYVETKHKNEDQQTERHPGNANNQYGNGQYGGNQYGNNQNGVNQYGNNQGNGYGNPYNGNYNSAPPNGSNRPSGRIQNERYIGDEDDLPL